MEDNRKGLRRGLGRRFECNRLAEQLWALAYEQVWPVIQGSCKQDGVQRRRKAGAKIRLARRA
jgi:hypothetical protein